ncbi:hypothetical protein KYI07_11295 (plasmid) [Macrococcus psychrotolerans]|uniref:Uncharacterized protein n=1 Tax=Macrococcus psychrotolerans TaxID=3039389 RepID=A0AAT9P9H4_9STAP|nr:MULTISPECIES: hypothetical protein [Macrococcus]QYA34004.1 hypothetical protein KYI10_11405 [Macrococcus sp. 19Msa1099]QYA38789.1 hypothetical protein KYI07_11295 [Macrococcus caseolyticus]QYA77514.1 hypothetical protein KYI12_11385 [Macrococcus caseolyticus]
MKKNNVVFFTLILIGVAISFLNVSYANAQESEYLTIQSKKNLETLNENPNILNELVRNVNKDLSNGASSSLESYKFEDGSEVYVGVEEKQKDSSLNQSNQIISFKAINSGSYRTKDYQAYVGYKGPGFDFKHRVSGTFQYNKTKKVVRNVTFDPQLSGTFYSKSEKTYVEKHNAGTHLVNSTGHFTALKVFAQYTTKIKVACIYNGTFNVTEARVVK